MSLLNNDWKEQIGKKDNVLWNGKVDNSCILFYSILAGGAILLPLIIVIIVFMFKLKIEYNNFIILILLLISISSAIYSYYAIKANKFVITDKGCYRFYGIFFKKQTFVSFGKITNIILQKGFVENMFFGLATINIDTASSGFLKGGQKIYECSFFHIEDFQEVREIIQSKL